MPEEHPLSSPDVSPAVKHQHLTLQQMGACLPQALARLHPAGLGDDWADKLAGQGFFSRAQKATFEHYMQVRHALSSPH